MTILVKFVSSLTEEQTNQLKEILKPDEKPRPRLRAQAILWSSQTVSIEEIAHRCAVDRETISTWRDRGEQLGLAGLNDKPRPGNPGRLTFAEKSLIFEWIKAPPRSLTGIRAT